MPKRVRLGGRVWRHWYSPGPMSCKAKAWTVPAWFDRETPWYSCWGWKNTRAYYDITYNKNSTYTWYVRAYGSNTYNHESWIEVPASCEW